MSNIEPLISAEKQQQQKEVWMEAFDDVNLKSTNLRVAIEAAYQRQCESADFDCWILIKIREEVIELHEIVREAFKKFD